MPTGRLYEIFKSTRQFSYKLDSYFAVYEELFAKFVGQPITFVEVGVFHGGSLCMWREYFGPQARIIGIDFDPDALQWQQQGIEIVIGDQGNPEFWEGFFARVGRIDALVDDGGHSNLQQVVTLLGAVDYINDGGVLVIEDVHTSYMADYGNPSRYSFINFAKRVVDVINSRFDEIPSVSSPLRDQVHFVAFYESVVVFHIDRRRAVPSHVITNDGQQSKGIAALYGPSRSPVLRFFIRLLKGIPFVRSAARTITGRRTLAKFFD